MITNSVSSTPTPVNSSDKTITQHINVKITKCIFKWETPPEKYYPETGTNCHCLLRIYDFESENRAVIIASSLWSNNDNRGIWSDLDCFVQAVVNKFPYLSTILSNSTWITHSGQFSYQMSWSETFHRDHFDTWLVSLNDCGQVEVDEESETEIKLDRLREFINQLPIEPATEVLKQLEHDNGWEGIVDDEQIKACWELENGIVLGQIRETGLVGW